MEILDVRGDALELVADWDPGDADEFRMTVLETPIIYSPATRRLTVGKERAAFLPLSAGEPLRLDIFIDCSVIEVFANGRTCVTARSYVENPAASPVSIASRGGAARLRSLIVYEMNAISPDRLTT
jgi:beta-fructofuranosidase